MDWLCGQEAGKALRELVRRQDVICEAKDVDRYGRVVAVCKAGGQDINAAMVASGLALAYRLAATTMCRRKHRPRPPGGACGPDGS